MTSQDLVDDALSRVSELGTVGAMKWLAKQFEERESHTVKENDALAAELSSVREAVQGITGLLENKEWSESLTTDPDVSALEVAVGKAILPSSSKVRDWRDEALRVAKEGLAFYAENDNWSVTFAQPQRDSDLAFLNSSPYWRYVTDDGRGHEQYQVTTIKALDTLDAVARLEPDDYGQDNT